MEEIFVPALGMAMTEAVLSEWLVQPGNPVTAGDVIAVIETDKTNYDLTAEGAGVLGAHRFAEGDHVPVGATVAVLLAPGETDPSAAASAAPGASGNAAHPGQPESAAAPPAAAQLPDPALAASTGAGQAPQQPAPGARAPHRLSPRQRRLAALAASAGEGSGHAAGNGSATRTEDHPAAHAAAEVPAEVPAAAGAPVGPTDRARAAISAAVSESWRTIPHFAVSSLIPADTMAAEVARASTPLAKVTVTDALLRALALAVAEVVPGPGGPVGLAVATSRGVVNVAIAGAAEESLQRIARSRRVAVDRARTGHLNTSDAERCEVTLSNLGTHGVHWFTGIVPVGQGMLLTAGAIHEVVTFPDGAAAASKAMWATLNLDHRRFDGADGARILGAFAAVLADPDRLKGPRAADARPARSAQREGSS